MSWVSDYLRTRRAALEHDLGVKLGRVLGCGSFGCVVEAKKSQRNLVLKLTVDRDEVAMWRRLLELIGSERISGKGLVKVTELGEIVGAVEVDERTADYGKRGLVLRANPPAKAYAILREPIVPVSKEDDGKFSPETQELVAMYGSADFGVFRRAMDHVFAAGRMWNELRYSSRGRGSVVDSMHRFVRREVHVDIHDVRSEEETLEELNVWIGALHRVPYARELAQTLADCANEGIIFADLKTNNVGWRVGPASKRQAVIFDVGGTPVP